MTELVYQPSDGAYRVKTSHDIVVAAPDGTPLKLTCRWPEEAAPRGFVVFCHGLGASGDHYVALSEFWAAHGYLVIHPTFPDWVRAVADAEPQLGCDRDSGDLAGWPAIPAMRARMHEILHAPEWWLKRIDILDSVFDALDTVIETTVGRQDTPLSGAIAGHSFGAYVAQLIAGTEIDIPDQGTCSFADNRVVAAILLSAQGPGQQGLQEGSWENVAGPMLTVTGTLDRGALGQDWKWKSQPFYLSPPGGKYLAVLDEGDHYLGGFDRFPGGKDVPAQRDAVRQLTLAFLDAWVVEDQPAQSWLGSIADRIGDCPVLFERK